MEGEGEGEREQAGAASEAAVGGEASEAAAGGEQLSNLRYALARLGQAPPRVLVHAGLRLVVGGGVRVHLGVYRLPRYVSQWPYGHPCKRLRIS